MYNLCGFVELGQRKMDIELSAFGAGYTAKLCGFRDGYRVQRVQRRGKYIRARLFSLVYAPNKQVSGRSTILLSDCPSFLFWRSLINQAVFFCFRYLIYTIFKEDEKESVESSQSTESKWSVVLLGMCRFRWGKMTSKVHLAPFLLFAYNVTVQLCSWR